MGDNNEPLDLAAIEARLAKITPGGWTYWWVDDEERFRLDLIEGDRFIAKKVWDEVDAKFIANAPTDIAALVEEVKKQSAVALRLKRNIEFLIKYWGNHSSYSRDTIKLKAVLERLGDALVSENLFSE